MKTAKYTRPKHFDVVEVPIPTPGDGETIVKVEFCSICGSDVHSFVDGKNTDVLGHEFVGEIVAMGPNPPKDAEIGRRVVINTLTPCGHCTPCENGHPNLCINRRRPNPGAYSQYIKTVKEGGKKMIYPVPDEIDSLQACLMEPLGVACHAVDTAKSSLRLNDTVVVFGAGAIGLLITAVLSTIGVIRIIQVDVSDKRLEAAKKLGASYTINGMKADAVKEIEKITGSQRNLFGQPGAVDAVFECAGTHITESQALDVVRPGGSIYQIALPQKDVSVNLQRLAYKEVKWQGLYAFTYEYPQCLDLLKTGAIDLTPMISDVYPLEKINDAFERQMDAQNSVKVIIKCSD